jgi:hypothetical protein
MKIVLTVKMLDGDAQRVVAQFADFVAFERTWNRSVAKLESDMRLTDVAWLAWHVLKRTKKTTAAFDPEWIGTVSDIEVDDSEERGDGFLEQTPSPGSQPS